MNPCWSEEHWQAYLDGELSSDTRDGMTAHLAECAMCATCVQDIEQTMMMMDSAWASELPETIPVARLRARVDAALAEQAAPRFSLAWLWNWKLAAVAAAILLAVSLFFLRQPKPLPQPEARSITPVPISPPDHQTLSLEPDLVLAAQAPQRRKHRLRHLPARKVEDTETVTPFFPLREEEDIAALESVRLVRVELPGSALGEVGLLVDQETAPASVKADVLLGDDGLARAIRFVR